MMVTSWKDNDGNLHTAEPSDDGCHILLRCCVDEEMVMIPVEDWPKVCDGIQTLYESATRTKAAE